MRSFQVHSSVAEYLAYDLHFQGLSEEQILNHPDWNLFGLSRMDVLEEFKRLSLKGYFILQTGGKITRISWKFKDPEALCDVLAER